MSDNSSCELATAFLQRKLDGETIELPSDVAEHCRSCTVCRERFLLAERLLGYAVSPPQVPLPLSMKFVIEADRTIRRRLLLRRVGIASSALAAGLLLAFAMWTSTARVDPAQSSNGLVKTLPAEATNTFAAGASQAKADFSGPWNEARQGFSASVEPMVSSTRQAFGMLWRDFGLAHEAEDR